MTGVPVKVSTKVAIGSIDGKLTAYAGTRGPLAIEAGFDLGVRMKIHLSGRVENKSDEADRETLS